MKLGKLILEIALIAGLTLISPKGSEQKSMGISSNFNEIELTNKQREAKAKENIFYYSPFRNIKNEVILPLDDSTSLKINLKAQEFLNKSLNEANKIYEKEKITREQNQNLLYLVQEYNSELRDSKKKDERILLNKSRGINIENSKWVDGMKIYSPEDTVYQKQIKNYLDSLEYFGSAFILKDHMLYSPKKGKDFIKKGLKPIDCTSFVLETLSRAQNKNYYQSNLSRAFQIAKMLNKKGFESIYLAENTLDTSKQYFYGVEKQFHSGDFIKKIKKKQYYFPINYLITDSNFENDLFKEFLEQSSGFVFLQEGVHLGFLDKGNFIDAHITANPLSTPVFTSRRFYDLVDNNNPKVDYQSAILCLPKGSVEKFLYENRERIQH
jgi:hypothetical protein